MNFKDNSNKIFVILGLLISIFYSSYLLTGSYLLDISYPYFYTSDGLIHSWITQRIIEGSVYYNDRSGFPYGGNFYDFPGADFLNNIALKLISIFFYEYWKVNDIFIISSFPLVFLSSYFVLKKFTINSELAFLGGILFAFIPFHIFRIGHLYYQYYWVVPIWFLIGYKIFKNEVLYSNKILLIFIIFCISSCGVYYSIFGMIMLSIAGLSGFFKNRSFAPLKKAIILIIISIFSVLINLSPNIYFNNKNGANYDATQRSAIESEVSGLKLIQLVLPKPEHRNAFLSGILNKYEINRPLVNENRTVSLGIIGSIGLLILSLSILLALSNRRVDDRISFFSISITIFILFGTIGGLGAIFSEFITPLIRGWNRVSIFIGFGCIAAFLIIIKNIICTLFGGHKGFSYFIVAIVLFFGLWDQTSPPCLSCQEAGKNIFLMDREFIGKIESLLPDGSSIYQMPYKPFPEGGDFGQCGAYNQATGFINSKELKWSFGASRGRETDQFYHWLSQRPIWEQVDAALDLGFSGIYYDKRCIQGIDGNSDLIYLDKYPGFNKREIREDGNILFYRFYKDKKNSLLYRDKPDNIFNKIGYDTRIIPIKLNIKSNLQGGEVHCSLDSINRRPPLVVNEVGQNSRVVFSGWSLLSPNQPLPTKMYLEFSGAESKFLPILIRQERRDVAFNFNSSSAVNSGWDAYANQLDLPKGSYDLKIIMFADDIPHVCDTKRQILVK